MSISCCFLSFTFQYYFCVEVRQLIVLCSTNYQTSSMIITNFNYVFIRQSILEMLINTMTYPALGAAQSGDQPGYAAHEVSSAHPAHEAVISDHCHAGQARAGANMSIIYNTEKMLIHTSDKCTIIWHDFEKFLLQFEGFSVFQYQQEGFQSHCLLSIRHAEFLKTQKYLF